MSLLTVLINATIAVGVCVGAKYLIQYLKIRRK